MVKSCLKKPKRMRGRGGREIDIDRTAHGPRQ